MHIYLIRHGQSYVNLPEWEHGNTDEGLTDLGKEQAAALARQLPREVPQIDALYASTMLRTRETAEALARAYGCTVVYDDRLREVGNNRLDHSPYPNEMLPNEYADFWGSARPFSALVKDVDGGESWMHFRMRIGLFLEEMVERHYPLADGSDAADAVLVAVCHGGVIEATLNHVFNIGHNQHCEVGTHNTGVTYIQYVNHPERETWRLRYHNRVDHLRGIEEGISF